MHSLAALQCWGKAFLSALGAAPVWLLLPAHGESRTRGTAGMGLAVGYLRSWEQALTPCVCQPPLLSSPALLGGVPALPTAPDPAYSPWAQVTLQPYFPAHLCTRAVPAAGEETPHTLSHREARLDQEPQHRNRQITAGTGEGMGWDSTHGYVQAGMGLDELLHQCRAQAEVPTAGMSMSNMLRPWGAHTSVESGRERNPKRSKGLG